MTREEAIKHGKEQLEVFGGEHREFIDMAIKALEQEPCEDAISRQEALKGYIEVERADGVEIYSEKAVPITYINNLPPVTPTQRWIPVSERLPIKEEYIANNGLFIVSDGNRTYAEYFDVYNSKKYFGEPTMIGFRVDRCVIAWMPLPEPYKAESEG